MRLLLLTGGGHVDFFPGLEVIIKAERERNNTILGSLNGWAGIQKGSGGVVDITDYPIENFHRMGGSFLGSSRTKPDLEKVISHLRKFAVDVVVPFGGEDTLGIANMLHNQFNVPIVGWPKTMDNDTGGSYASIGYIKAADVAMRNTLEALSTAYTHSRIVLLPVFGRNTDWIAGAAADYGHAHYVIPAEKKDLSLAVVAQQIKRIYHENKERYGNPFAVVVVSEAASGLGGVKRICGQASASR